MNVGGEEEDVGENEENSEDDSLEGLSFFENQVTKSV